MYEPIFARLGAGLLVASLLAACSGSKPAPSESDPGPEADPAPIGQAETVQPAPAPAGTRPDLPEGATFFPATYQVVHNTRGDADERARLYDLIHTELDLRFDFANELVFGTAAHRLTPVAHRLDALPFDGRDMEVRSVRIERPGGRVDPAEFTYDNVDLTVRPAPALNIGDTVVVHIEYTAHPTRNGRRLGLHVVDGAKTDPALPTQIWTLGQPEDNQYWFPTWDYPNDFMTFGINLTVPNAYTTVSNGALVQQTPLADGLRRDRWVIDRPMASYLAGFVVGEYAAGVGTYRRADGSEVPLAYLVEPAFAGRTDLIFGETDDMMGVFERVIGYPYPWSNYKQVAVREFTASGMENTTATVLFDRIQHDERAHLDYTGRNLIAHELAHQWFGNLLTSRNWAHLGLNEGFARYMEVVYLEAKYGWPAAQAHAIELRDTYLEEAETLRRPIVWYGYDDPNQMYDRHTYEKAALVLHQLRYEIGDDAFWQGVRTYVRRGAGRPVVLEDLRTAMEQAAGKNLAWFFDQWMKSPGHPELYVTQSYYRNRGLYEVKVAQVQDPEATRLFDFTFDIVVHFEQDDPLVQQVRMHTADTTYRFALVGNVSYVRFNAGDWILGDIQVKKRPVEWIAQARRDDEMAARYDAVTALGALEPSEDIRNTLLAVASGDAEAAVRKAAVVSLGGYAQDPNVRGGLLNAAKHDTESSVRKAALNALSVQAGPAYLEALTAALGDRSYEVIALAIELMAENYPGEALAAFQSLQALTSWDHVVERALIAAYGRMGVAEGVGYLNEQLAPSQTVDVRVAAVDALTMIAERRPEIRDLVLQQVLLLIDNTKEPIRFATAQALTRIGDASIEAPLRERLERESSARVRQALNQALQRI